MSPALLALLAVSAVQAAPRHVVLLSIDTLRADHLGAYGNPTVKTPNLDALAARGVLFEEAIATAPTTLASHTSMMTGEHPHTHGLPRNGFVVPAETEMLAEVLSQAGFTTAGFVGGRPLHSETAFNQGFAHYDDDTGGASGDQAYWRDGREVVSAVDAWLSGGGKDAEHLFLFVHLFDVHSPYRPPEPWLSMYDPPTVPGLAMVGSADHVKAAAKLPVRGKDVAADLQHEALRRHYAGGVSYADELVGRLLSSLQKQGVLDQALFIVTSDHGEAMDQHADELWDHGKTVYDETIHVPLIVRLPMAARGGQRVGGVVSLVDLFPTVLDMLQLPARPTEGLSLAPLLAGGTATRHPYVFAEATKPQMKSHPRWLNTPRVKAVRGDRYKLVWDPTARSGRLFDLDQDPDELTDRAADPALAAFKAKMQAAAQSFSAAAAPPAATEVSTEDVTEALRALGYIDE